MHITVYLDRLKGTNPDLVRTLHELGTWMGQNGHTLIYNSSKTGLTDALVADVLAAGGTVIDIAPQFSTNAEPQDSPKHKHKERVIEVGGAFIAFPGDSGSVVEDPKADFHIRLTPCILYNPNGYYDYLIRLLRHMVEMGVSTKERQAGVHFVETLEEIQQILNNA